MESEQQEQLPPQGGSGLIHPHQHTCAFVVGKTAIVRGCTTCGVADILTGTGAGTWRSTWERIKESYHFSQGTTS